MIWDWGYAFEILPVLGWASIVTVQATILGFILAAVLGLVFAILRMSENPLISIPIAGFVEFIRSTPLLIQIFFIYFVLPEFGITLNALTAGILALGMHYGTYCSEVYRAGLEGVPRGQWEAATALNLSPYDTFKDVIIPQAIPPVVPALGNYLVALFKETPLLSAIAVLELMQTAKILGSQTFRYTEPITLVGLFFLAMSLVSAALIREVERTSTAGVRDERRNADGPLRQCHQALRAADRARRPRSRRGAQGEKVAIIGPSGSGKTTVLRMLMTLERIDEGVIWVDGEPLTHMKKNGALVPADNTHLRRVRGKIGMVFQHFNLFPHMTALGNCTEAPRRVLNLPAAEAEARGVELLEMVGLADKVHHYPAQLSGGQQQRVAIARALAMRPKIMLFDEVTSALDPELVGEVLNVIRKLGSEHDLTMLMVTHQMGFAKEFADRVCFFYAGKIAEQGKADEFFANPQNERTRQFLRAVLEAG
jgi:polar amino acid transport system ATP-binding protein